MPVQPYPANGDRYTVSVGGGIQPAWRRDGREIYYLTPTVTLKVVTVDAKSGNFKSAVPQNLFDFDIDALYAASRLYQPWQTAAIPHHGGQEENGCRGS